MSDMLSTFKEVTAKTLRRKLVITIDNVMKVL